METQTETRRETMIAKTTEDPKTILLSTLETGQSIDDAAREAGLDVCEDYESRYTNTGVAILEPGWCADDGTCEIHYSDADSGEEAAQDYVDDGDWGDGSKTTWIDVRAYRRGWALDENGEPVKVTAYEERHQIELEPDEPECTAGEHDWQSPIEIVGGCKENPGVYGHGGGTISTEVCAHCGVYRITDTWAQDRSSGVQGLTSVEYREADENSRRR